MVYNSALKPTILICLIKFYFYFSLLAHQAEHSWRAHFRLNVNHFVSYNDALSTSQSAFLFLFTHPLASASLQQTDNGHQLLAAFHRLNRAINRVCVVISLNTTIDHTYTKLAHCVKYDGIYIYCTCVLCRKAVYCSLLLIVQFKIDDIGVQYICLVFSFMVFVG